MYTLNVFLFRIADLNLLVDTVLVWELTMFSAGGGSPVLETSEIKISDLSAV